MIGALLLAAANIALCESCHGPGGNSAIAGTPSIAGQPATFLENQLVFFREGLRNSPVMQGIAAAMKDEDITALAKHFSTQPAKPASAQPPDSAASAQAAELAKRLHCAQCHLPSYAGRDQMPRLAGQREEYLVEAMVGYRDGKRAGGDNTMSEVLYGVSDGDIKALAKYLASLQ